MLNRLNWSSHLLLALLTVSLIGCSQQPVSKPPGAAVQALPFNIVSTGDSRVDLTAATTFSWAAATQVPTGDPRMDDVQLQKLLRAAISNAMTEKGYQATAAGAPADLLVGYSITLNDDARTDKDIVDNYGVQASINVSSPDPALYEKGTLVIDIIDSRTGLMAWRSALQGFTDSRISEQERRQRINLMVQRMLAGLPVRHAGQ